MAIQIQVRRDTAANWASENPTPALGEPCLETDTGVLKFGDNATTYNSLTAFSVGREVVLTAAAYAALTPPDSTTKYYIVG